MQLWSSSSFGPFLVGLNLLHFGVCVTYQGDCTPPAACDSGGGLVCTSYGIVPPGGPKTICECPTPTNMTDCSCTDASASFVARRWRKSNGQSTVPKLPPGKTGPAAGFTRPGCYLENGELCANRDNTDPAAATYTICMYAHFCELIDGNPTYGFCRSFAPCHRLSLSAKLISCLLLCLHLFSSRVSNEK